MPSPLSAALAVALHRRGRRRAAVRAPGRRGRPRARGAVRGPPRQLHRADAPRPAAHHGAAPGRAAAGAATEAAAQVQDHDHGGAVLVVRDVRLRVVRARRSHAGDPRPRHQAAAQEARLHHAEAHRLQGAVRRVPGAAAGADGHRGRGHRRPRPAPGDGGHQRDAGRVPVHGHRHPGEPPAPGEFTCLCALIQLFPSTESCTKGRLVL
ncbi:hypothetical protein ONE63_005785 [Megalurothrips usitatus]|uniref:Uncharacterized protein n=1 Tax=Megalurothrips usitatus TaxID=439358 RepID=A0AAV7XWM7_9NEOP|nr:hypothetical protein ONE63_005785 [Megalurothrips usitatus]